MTTEGHSEVLAQREGGETRAARRLALAIRDHEIGATERARFRAVVERSRFLPHDSSPTIPPTAPPASESEQDR